MKHSFTALIFLICIALTISACAGTGSADITAEPEPTAVFPEPSPEPDDRYDPEPSAPPSTVLTDAIAEFPGLSAKQTSAMSSWAQYGFGLVEGNTYYGRFFLKGETTPMLFAISLKSEKYEIKADSRQILDSEHSPKYLLKAGDVLYYIMLDRYSGESLGIAKTGTDGSDAQVLYQGKCSFLSSAGEKLFFTDSRGFPVCMDMNGGDPEAILERKVFYLYALSEDWLIFQDDADNESLHLYRISDGADIKLNDEAGFNPVIVGTSLFFSVRDPEINGAFRIACADLSSYGERYDEDTDRFVPVFTVHYGEKPFGGEFYICGNTIRAMNGAEPIALENWAELEDDAYESVDRIIRYASEKWIVEELTGKDGGITAMMFHDRSGGYASVIRWLN